MTQLPDDQSRMMLIDGNAMMHRAFHALPPLTDKNGRTVNAVYGFLSILLSLIDKHSPTHLIVCFDRPEPTFRKSMYAGYQAKRPKMDDELSGQFELAKKAISSMNIPIYEKAGFEADDVIGTLAYQVAGDAQKNSEKLGTTHSASNLKNTDSSDAPNHSEFSEIIIVTGDRDILQLVNEKVHVYMPAFGLSNGTLYTDEKVKEKYGVHPWQIVDYKALAGDPSDNYPGVRGVGPKTASTLLQTFGTIENLYDAIYHQDEKARELKDKTIQALSEYAEDAGMAKKLAKILHDAPVTIDIKEAELPDFNTPEVLDMLQELGFGSLVKRVMGVEQSKDQVNKGTRAQKTQKQQQDDSEQLSLM